MLTLDDGITNTRLGAISTDVSHVTTRRPSRNFPGVAPPAPQIQIIWKKKILITKITCFTMRDISNEAVLRQDQPNVIYIWNNNRDDYRLYSNYDCNRDWDWHVTLKCNTTWSHCFVMATQAVLIVTIIRDAWVIKCEVGDSGKEQGCWRGMWGPWEVWPG